MQNFKNNFPHAPWDLIEEFLKQLNQPLISIVELDGGTQQKPFLINNSYVFKAGTQQKNRGECMFNNHYKDCPITHKVYLCEINNSYIVFKYIVGENKTHIPNVKRFVKKVLKFINSYTPIGLVKGFGDVNLPQQSWHDFLFELYNYNKTGLEKHFTPLEFKKIEQEIVFLGKSSFSPNLLHGDLRLDNFIFKNNKLVGIIDPFPLVGDSLYDKIFFLISSKQILEKFSFNKIVKLTNEQPSKVLAMLKLVLMIKIKRIIKYENQLDELDYYLDYYKKMSEL